MNGKRWNHLMVAVRDLDRASQGLVRKAGALAKRVGARLEVVHVTAVETGTLTLADKLADRARLDAQLEQQRRLLQKLVKPVQAQGLNVTCSVVWDYPTAEGIVRHVLKRKPDLLLVQSARHSAIARWFLSNTDWELIRQCPCPLWIVRSPRLPEKLSVLAAIDPFHARAKPARLDHAILQTSQQLVAAVGGTSIVCHAYMLPQQVIAAMNELAVMPVTPAQARGFESRAKTAVRKLAGEAGIARNNQLVIEGDPVTVIPDLIRQRKVQLLAMGAVSRRGLSRILIGNTAERMLDAVECDLLVIKPRGFKPTIPRQGHRP